MPIGCRKNPPEPLHIACSDDMLPVAAALGEEFRQNFGVPVLATRCEPAEFTFGELTNYDLIITDDLALAERLVERGTISTTTGFAYATPAMVLRRGDHLPLLKLADLAAMKRPLRMTVASGNGTLSQIVKARLSQLNVPIQGEAAKIQLLPYLVEEIRSDGAKQRTTPDIMLQQLRDKETDIVVFWDFIAAGTIAKPENSDDFVTVAWPPEADDTITIPLCMVKDCSEFSGCRVFIDFVKSNRGCELLKSRSLVPSDDLIEARQ